VRRGGLALVVSVVLVALALGGLVAARSGPGATRAGARAAASTEPDASPAVPAVVKDCWVPTATGNVSLTAQEAMALTTAAARAAGSRRQEPRVQAAVARTLTVPPDQAPTVVRSLLGDRSTQRLTCSYVRIGVDPEDAGPSGLTPRARRLRASWTEVFGPLTAGGFARGGVRSGHVDSSSHYDGRAVDVFFRPVGDPEQRRLGRVFAQWLVAHAQEFHVLSVIFADQIWTSWAAYAGWRPYVHPSGNRTNAVLRHLDHVHVAVESGRPYRG
jgi:hypothetical protein